MLTAAKEGTFSASSDPCVFFPLTASEGVPKKSRLGFARKNPAPHQGSAWSNSGKALGIEEVVWENCGRSDDSARYYDPTTARFISEDESEFSESSNFYPYVGNDPTNLIDDTGFHAQKPPNLPFGTPKKYWKPFSRGMKQALKRLNNKPCAELFENSCHEGPDLNGANQMKNTEYRFVPLPQGSGVGAQTVDSTHVQVNSMGLFMTAVSGRITLPDGSTFDLGSAQNVQAMILLHELGHQLGNETGFTPDVDAATNAAHTKRIIDACFQKH